MKTLRFEVPHFCSAPARSSPKQSSHKNIHYLLVALATVSVFALGAQASTITENFSTPSTQAQIDVNYPQWSFIPADLSDNATVTVAEGQLRLGGDRSDPTQFQLKTAPVGAFVLDVDLGAFPGDYCRNIGIQVGPNEIVFHPGYGGTALRVEGPGGFYNTDIGFTLAPEVLHHFNLISDGRGLFTITLKDSLNDSNVYSTSFSNPAAVSGLISITRASCQGAYGEVHADNFVLLTPECTPPPSGIVSWWPGDGNADDIAGGNHGTLVNGATFAPGRVGQAFSFDGVDDYVEVPHAASLDLSGGMTLEAWLKLRAPGYSTIFSKSDYLGLHWITSYALQINPDGAINVALYGTYPEDNWTTVSGLVAVNQWYHVGLTWDGTYGPSDNVKLYLNGALLQTWTKSLAPLNVTTQTLTLGSMKPPTYYGHMDGLIDEAGIFSRALTAEEIAAIYAAGSAGKCKPGDNQPPVAVCKDVSVTAGASCTASALIDNGSYDPDGDPITPSQSPAGPYNLGPTSVTLTVTDDKGASDSCQGTVTVVDNTPPTNIVASSNPSTLWPPNHQMVPVTVTATASDNCGTATCKIIFVTSNEPVNGLGDGDTAPDWEITGDLSVNLRSERSGKGNGRIYTINFKCADAAGNLSSPASVTVSVPKNQKK